jgi:uncharacterized protein (DUF952 family)
MTNPLIYHLVAAADYRAQPFDQPYQTATLVEEGFIHCTAGLELLVQVANDYYATLAGELLVLEIDPGRLAAPLKFEPPLPPHGSEDSVPVEYRDHLFPHIYGPLNRDAIRRIFALVREPAGWRLPDLTGDP